MPELPEVEVTRLGLTGRLEGAEVLSVRLGKPLRWPLGIEPAALRGAHLGVVQRRGKYLWLPVMRHAGDTAGLLWHLGMSGSLAWLPVAGDPGAHDHVDLLTSLGVLRLTDPRRFGAVVWGEAMDAGLPGRLLSTLGPEPFDPNLTADRLYTATRGRRVAIKQALMTGDLVVGVGNIYASEALFRAGIHPSTPAGRLTRPRYERLLATVRQVLGEAIELGGSSLRDFRHADGAQGHFQLATQVYGRAGLACRHCGTPIRRVLHGQRATFFCPSCQKR